MLIYMLKDVEKIGMAGQVVKVSDGHARNCLIPQKLAIKADKNQIKFSNKKTTRVVASAAIVSTKVGMLAERIKNMYVTVKKRVHDDGKLYGAVGADEIVELLKGKDVTVSKKQIEFNKSIRAVGEHKAVIRLNAKLKPELTVKVVALS